MLSRIERLGLSGGVSSGVEDAEARTRATPWHE